MLSLVLIKILSTIRTFTIFIKDLMESRHQFSLYKSNSFSVRSVCSTIYFPTSVAELKQLPDLSSSHFYILGDGSNTLFVERKAPIIITPDFKGVNVSDTETDYIVRVGAGENWHDLVCTCISKNIRGLENLALIPGSVGAAPVQNIGAYGVELSDFCTQVTWFEFSSKTIRVLTNDDCRFSYRNSIFKQNLYNKGIITEVEFSFPKAWRANLSYTGLNELEQSSTAEQVMKKVISLRQKKLPDPNKLPNAGSFFKNPIINKQTYTKLKSLHPNMPSYPQKNGQVKLAAGWLIEHSGLKGYCVNGVGVHEHQALVLVNYESDKGTDIVKLAKHVQQKVHKNFNILISPEVRMITAQGEQNFADLAVEHE